MIQPIAVKRKRVSLKKKRKKMWKADENKKKAGFKVFKCLKPKWNICLKIFIELTQMNIFFFFTRDFIGYCLLVTVR